VQFSSLTLDGKFVSLIAALGRLAQLVERSLHTGEVIGSSPIAPTSAWKQIPIFWPNC
jgi:hypothetical protein